MNTNKNNFYVSVEIKEGKEIKFRPGEICVDESFSQIRSFVYNIYNQNDDKIMYSIGDRISPDDDGIWIYPINGKDFKPNTRITLIPWRYIKTYCLYDKQPDNYDKQPDDYQTGPLGFKYKESTEVDS